MHPRLDGMSLYPFPKTEPSMDFTRRRGPPAPLQLGAAYQAKVLRGYKKFSTPQPLELCLLVDSACDQVIRQNSREEMQRQRESVESKRQSKSTTSDTFYTLDETQIDSSDDGSEHTLWSYEDNVCDSMSSCTLDASTESSVERGFHKASLARRPSQAMSIVEHGQSSTESGSVSPIKLPAMCRIEQAGIHDWMTSAEKGKRHRHTKSI